MTESDHEDAAPSATEPDALRAAFEDAVGRAAAGSAEALDDVIAFAEAVRRRTGDDVYVGYVEALARLDRFDIAERAGDPDFADRDVAIDLLRAARPVLSTDESIVADVALRLGLALSHRVFAHRSGTAPDLDYAIDALAAGLTAEPADTAATRLARLRHGLLLTFRFTLTAGDADDHARAVDSLTAALAAPAVDQATSDAVRVALAQLQLTAELPADLRRGGDGVRKLTLEALKAGTAQGISPESAAAALEHLEALSENSGQDESIYGMAAVLRLTTKLTESAGPEGLAPEDMRTAASVIERAAGHEAPGSPEAAALTTLRAALDAQLAHMARVPGSPAHAEAIENLLSALPALDGHPLHAMARDLLGALSAVPSATGAEEDLDRAVERLERVVDELDGHPGRERTLVQLTMLALRRAAITKSAASLDRIHAVLSETSRRPGSSDQAGTLKLMLSWTEGFQAIFASDAEGISAAIRQLQEAAEDLPPDHELRPMLGANLTALLAQRYAMTHNLEDLDAIIAVPEPPEDPVGSATAWVPKVIKVITALARSTTFTEARLNELDAELDEALAGIPADQLPLYGMDRLRDVFAMLRSAHGPGGMDFPRTGSALARFRGAAESMVLRSSRGAQALDWTIEEAMILIGSGFAGHDLDQVGKGIEMLSAEAARPSEVPQERLAVLGSLGLAFQMRSARWRRPRDLDNAIVRLEEARSLALREPGLVDQAPIFHQLGECYFTRGDAGRRDHVRAAAAGIAGLRARMQDVLVQTGASRALDSAQHAENEAAEVARWCVTSGDHESAVQALELGRGMVLHSATVDADTPALLRAGGRPDLADRWEREAGGAQPAGPPVFAGATIPSTLRRDVLLAMEGTDAERRQLVPPTVTEVAAALRRSGAAALVYLVPHRDDSAAFAIIVPADGPPRAMALPEVRLFKGSPIDVFERAQRDVQQHPDGPEGAAARARWTAAVERLATWAWPNAIGPVLEDTRPPATRHPPRVILAPVGRLGGVPWHAARRTTGGTIRYACQDAVITYAASARQFLDAEGRGRREWTESPALVAAAATTDKPLVWADEEIAALQRCHYPGADVGNGRAPSPATVRDLLPRKDSAGASLLHLACHAKRAEPPIDSFLVLARRKRLYVRDILHQATQRPADAPGGLVVLAACASDLTGSSQDEALTLATAFLAGGAAGVLGTRWPVRDLPTAPFMVMFHHYLNSGYPSPPRALHAAQLWMLDPGRKLPHGVGGLLAGEETRRDLETIGNWAAFTYQGL